MKNKQCFFVIVTFVLLCDLALGQYRRLTESCEFSEECISARCAKNRCASVKCRLNRDCLKVGRDHYCRDRGLKIIASECVPKKGKKLA
ncbi:hypothetical protein BpHYR1_031258 [Brachionus plicatilis]|uniref:Uncharacterized protein n=1 Tax=Brachionus plicatilis TaxID=10195 RepID=A0A3M7T7V8_BRAPC|nr:hypothetical protein BpHYR1_031258 [Brachionus plicatilis]